jgi:hypothetical protein
MPLAKSPAQPGFLLPVPCEAGFLRQFPRWSVPGWAPVLLAVHRSKTVIKPAFHKALPLSDLARGGPEFQQIVQFSRTKC